MQPSEATSAAALHNRSRLLPPLPCSRSTAFSGLRSESQRSCHEILSCYHGRDLQNNLSNPWVWQTNSDIPIWLTRNPMSKAFALHLSHWNEQTSPCFCINYMGIVQAFGYTSSSHHTVLLRMAAWWKRKQNQTLHHLMKLNSFNVTTHNGANPDLSEFETDVGLTLNE